MVIIEAVLDHYIMIAEVWDFGLCLKQGYKRKKLLKRPRLY